MEEKTHNYKEDFIMFKSFMNGFVIFMNIVKAAFEDSYNDSYAGWDEWMEYEMYWKTNMGLR